MPNNLFADISEAYRPDVVLTDEQRRAHLRKLRPADLIVAAAFQAGQAGALQQLSQSGSTDPLIEQLAQHVSHGAALIEAECKRRGIASMCRSRPMQ